MSNIAMAKQLYHLQWWGFDDYPCDKFVVADSVVQAMKKVQDEQNEKKLPCHNLTAICVQLVECFEIKPTEQYKVQRKIADDGCVMPYCECGYGLCFDDVFCGKCGSRLNWERFWNHE